MHPSPDSSSPNPHSPPLPPSPSITTSESDLLKHILNSYARTSFEDFAAAGYADFAYTVENHRWTASGYEECLPLTRREMDRLWVRCVMEGWVRMAWCWEEGDVEGVAIALLDREDGAGVEEMWEDRGIDYPDLDITLQYPMVGHNGIFEDYLDLGVRAVIDPQIRCYLEKTEDNTDNYDSYLGEAVYNLDLEGITAGEEVAEGVVVKTDEGTDDGLVDEDADGETVSIKEEDDGTENTLYGIREAVSSFHLTGSVDEDDADEEAVTVKVEEEDIKQEDNESTYDSLFDSPRAIQTPKIIFTPPSPSSSYGETTLAAGSAFTVSNQANEEITDEINASMDVSNQSMDDANEPMDSPSSDESNTDQSLSSLEDRLALLEALTELPVIKQESPPNVELTQMPQNSVMGLATGDSIQYGENAAPAAGPPRPYRAILPKVIIAPQLEYYGIPGHYRWVNGASHFFPHGARNYSTEIEIFNSPEFRTGYATAIADRVFQPGPEFYRMTPDERRTYMADWIAGSTARGEDFARNPAPAIRGQAAVHNQAPMFQVTTDRHQSDRFFHHGHCSVANMASILPQQTSVQNPGPYFQAQTADHSPGSYFQTQTPLDNTGPYFQAQSAVHNPAPTFPGANYSAPNMGHFSYGDDHLTHSTTPIFRTQTPPHRATGIYNDTNYPAVNAGSLFRTNPFINDYTPTAGLTFQTAPTMDNFNGSPAPIFRPTQYSFVNMTPTDIQAQEMADQFANSSLEVPRTRQSPRAKAEDGVVIKTEPGRCQSDSIFERKRTRDVDTDEENEYWNIERPRKFSG